MERCGLIRRKNMDKTLKKKVNGRGILRESKKPPS